MMSFKNDYCVSIKHNGKTLREFSHLNRYSVLLPFGSQYEILLINNSDKLAAVQVIIDGIDVCDNTKILLEPHDRQLLKGFYRSDAMNRAFKFVNKNNDNVDSCDNPNNGTIRVIFKAAERKQKPCDVMPAEQHNHYHYHYNDYCTFVRRPVYPHWQYYPYITCNNLKHDSVLSCYYGNNNENVNVNCSSAQNCCTTELTNNIQQFEQGATIAGGSISQCVKTVDDIVEIGTSTELCITLLGEISHEKIVKPVTVQDTKKKVCENCSNVDRFNAQFCSNCGLKYEQLYV